MINGGEAYGEEEDGSVGSGELTVPRGRYQPYLVLVCIDEAGSGDILRDDAPPKIVSARPMSGVVADGVTSVKLSPSGDFVVLGYGVRTTSEGGVPTRGASGDYEPHQAATVYRTSDMTHVVRLAM